MCCTRTAVLFSRMRTGDPFLSRLAVVDLCSHDVLGRVPGRGARNQRAHQHARDRRVAVGKMKVIRLRRRDFAQSGEAQAAAVWHTIETEPSKPGKWIAQQSKRGHGIDANAVQTVRARLVEGGSVGMHLHDVQQKILVAHAREPVFFLRLRHARACSRLSLSECGRCRAARQPRAVSWPENPPRLSHSQHRRLPGVPTTSRSAPNVSLSKK